MRALLKYIKQAENDTDMYRMVPMLKYIKQRVNNPDTYRDIMQEAALRSLEKGDAVPEEVGKTAWNTFRTVFRRMYRETHRREDESRLQELSIDPRPHLENRARIEQIYGLCRTDLERRVFAGRYDGLTLKEVTEKVGRPFVEVRRAWMRVAAEAVRREKKAALEGESPKAGRA